jgi:hypothetical protein
MTTLITSAAAIAFIAAVCLLAGCSTTGSSDRVSMGSVSSGYVCPLTGETLPCPKCCPLNRE